MSTVNAGVGGGSWSAGHHTQQLGFLTRGLAFDRSGNLFVADGGTNEISEISPDGLTISTPATNIAAPGYLAFGAVLEPSTWVPILLGGIVAVVVGSKRRWKIFPRTLSQAP